MNKPFSLAFLLAGVGLVIYGLSLSRSVRSDLSDMFNRFPGTPSGWLVIAGFILAVLGVIGFLRRSKAS